MLQHTDPEWYMPIRQVGLLNDKSLVELAYSEYAVSIKEYVWHNHSERCPLHNTPLSISAIAV